MQTFIENLVRGAGYWGVASLIFIENVFPPIPSELILLLAGFYTGRPPFLNIAGVAAAATVGSVVGALPLYYAGRLFGAERLERFAAGRGRFLGLKPAAARRAAERYAGGGGRSVFFCRLVPVLRSVISVPAGVGRMPLGSFLVLTAAGSLLWNTALCFAGRFAGENWGAVARVLDAYSYVALAVLAALAVALVIRAAVKRRRKS